MSSETNGHRTEVLRRWLPSAALLAMVAWCVCTTCTTRLRMAALAHAVAVLKDAGVPRAGVPLPARPQAPTTTQDAGAVHPAPPVGTSGTDHLAEAVVPWHALLRRSTFTGWRGADGHWSLSDGTIIGRDGDGSAGALVCGDGTWRDYQFSVRMTALSGGNMMLRFRDQGDGRCYLLDCLIGLKMAAIRVMGDPTHGFLGRRISLVDYPFVNGPSYEIAVAARGESITVAVDGHLLNQVTDATYAGGGVGLTVWNGEVAFSAPRIRFYPSGTPPGHLPVIGLDGADDAGQRHQTHAPPQGARPSGAAHDAF